MCLIFIIISAKKTTDTSLNNKLYRARKLIKKKNEQILNYGSATNKRPRPTLFSEAEKKKKQTKERKRKLFSILILWSTQLNISTIPKFLNAFLVVVFVIVVVIFFF